MLSGYSSLPTTGYNSQHISMMRSNERHLYSQATESKNNVVRPDIQQLIVMTDERIRREIALKLNFVLFLLRGLIVFKQIKESLKKKDHA